MLETFELQAESFGALFAVFLGVIVVLWGIKLLIREFK
jgi:hypothetical protein